jgi:protein-S-isoprenylcysteine O-methyltransferase Ste14
MTAGPATTTRPQESQPKQQHGPSLSTIGALALLAAVFTAALTFVTIELPDWLARQADRWIDIRDYHPAIEPDAIDEFMSSNNVRLIGWICLGLVAALIVAGLVTRRPAVSTAGAILLFIPTFGFFAGYMFFLAGLGVLRALWLPVWSGLLALGDVAYLPYMAIVWPLDQLGFDARNSVAYGAIALGLFVFIVSSTGWLTARIANQGVTERFLYRYSRHPQYLGWILWSYGMMLLAGLEPVPFGGENPGASLPWVVSTLVIVCVAWAEESRMLEREPTYVDYQRRTPFLFPVPKAVGRLLRAPLRRVIATDEPRTGMHLAVAFVVYLGLTMVLSLPFVIFDWPEPGWWAWPG